MKFAERTIRNAALESLVGELERGIAIISNLDAAAFAKRSNGASSIGAHIRHNLDFVNAMLNGIEEKRIDYNARPRDQRVESDREYAISELLLACESLKNLGPGTLASLVMVRSEVDEDLWHTSSVSREIEFLNSHTIHHYALVARILDDRGREVSSNFGVAPSTLRYRLASQA
jgi:hypothetical protein